MRYLIALLFVLCAHGEGKESPLYAFVAEKVSLEPIPRAEGEWDYRFKAKYRNLQNVYGDLPLGIIEFSGSDPIHIDPKFARLDHVILYLTETESGQYEQLERVYSVIYRTPEGKWAGPVDWYDYRNKANLDTPIKPIDITFPKSAGKPLLDYQVPHLHYYPEIWEPNFIVENNLLFPVKGNYIPELFELKKNGVLKDLGFFGGRKADSSGYAE